MKRQLKRLLCAFLAVLMLCSVMPMGFSLYSFAADEGLIFRQQLIHWLDVPLEEKPVTFSATVKIKESVATPGVIFGNYDAKESGKLEQNNITTDEVYSYVNFEIFENGVPGLSFMNAEGSVTVLAFDEVDARTGDFVTLTVVFKQGESASLYVNGELAQTVETTASYAADVLDVSNFVVGGTAQQGPTRSGNDDNRSYFLGNMKNLALYSAALDATEVAEIYANGANAVANGMIACYDLTQDVEGRIVDRSGNGHDASSFYKRFKDPSSYAYSFAVVGDTQTAVWEDVNAAWNNFGEGKKYATYEEALAAQKRTAYIYDWIVDNKDLKNIEYVFGVGDITEWKKDPAWGVDAEFLHAKSYISKLDEAGIPYSLVPGDHDESNRFISGYLTNDGTRDYSKFNEHFKDMLAPRVTGYYSDPEYPDSASYYINFEVGQTKYMLLALEVAAPNRILDWANELVMANPDRKVIITTHSFLHSSGKRVDHTVPDTHNWYGEDGPNVRNNGEQMWDEFVKLHENIVLVLSGHMTSPNIVRRQDKGVKGNTVTQILVNPQYMSPSYAMICMLYFSEDGSDIQVEWISAGTNRNPGSYISEGVDYLYRQCNQFSLSLTDDVKTKTSDYTDRVAILSNKKLLDKGLILYNTFDTWTDASATMYASASNSDLYTNVEGTNKMWTSAINGLASVETSGSGKAVKFTYSTGNQFYVVRNNDASSGTVVAGSAVAAYIGQSFVYQMDYRQSKTDGWTPTGVIYLLSKQFTESIPLLYVEGGYLYVHSVNAADERKTARLKDANGNYISVVGEEYTTLAVLVNPQLNKFWAIVNGKVIGDEGYTFMRKAEMQTLKDPVSGETYLYDEATGNYLDKDGNATDNPVPYRYLHYDIRCSACRKNDSYYDNSMLYYVDQSFTCEDYLDMLKPAGKTTVSEFTTKEDVLATGKVLNNGFILDTDFNNWVIDNRVDGYPSYKISADSEYAYGNGTMSNPWVGLVNSKKPNVGAILDIVGYKDKALKSIPEYAEGSTTPYGHFFGVIANCSAFAGNTFVYQMDYKLDEIQKSNIMYLREGTKHIIRCNDNGELYVGTNAVMKDENGNTIKLTAGEFTTIAVIVNPKLNRVWAVIDGKLINKDGYAVDLGESYSFTQVKCGGGEYAFSVDNAQLYFVDDTYTYEDYMGMVSPVKGNTATLGSTIGYNYYLNIPKAFIAANPDLMAKITVNGVTRRIKLADAAVTDYDVDGDGNVDKWVKITCNLSAAEMTRDIRITLVQGSTVFYDGIATVKKYADSITVENGYSEAAANVAKSMLVYGAYAQQYFEVDTDNLAADVSDAELKELPSEKMYGIVGNRFNYVSSALALKSETIICHYFDKADGLTFTLNGKKLTAVAEGNRFRVDIAVDAKNLDTVYALEVSDGNGNSYTINYSAVGYAQIAVNAGNAKLANLVKALYTYNVYADAYQD